MRYKIQFAILFICLISTQMYGATKSDYTREMHKEFSINSDGTVEFINKYGDINIETTSGQNVIIDVVIKVEARSETKAQEIFDRIDIDFSNTNQYVKAETSISNKKSSWFKGWWGNNGKNSYKINYTVKMPATCELQITNKYGDSFVGDIENDVDVNVKYGSLQMKRIAGELYLDMKYAKGAIESARKADIDLGYSNIKVGEIDELDLNSSYSDLIMDKGGVLDASSKYSDIRVEELKSLEAESRYDDFEVEMLDELIINGKYTHINVGRLNHSADLDLGYGGAKIQNIQSGFRSIDINSNYAGVKLGFASGASYTVDLQTKYCPVKSPDLNTTIDIRKNSSTTLKGYKGSSKGGTIKAEMDYGSLTIQ